MRSPSRPTAAHRARPRGAALVAALVLWGLPGAAGAAGPCPRVEDRGNGWRSVTVLPSSNGETRIFQFAIAPDDPDLMFASNSSEIQVTTDGGCTWKVAHTRSPGDAEALGGSLSELVIAPRPDPDGAPAAFALSYTFGAEIVTLLASEDGGATWKRRASFPGFELPTGRDEPSLVVAPSQPDVAFLSLDGKLGPARTGPYLFRTSDGGSTWTELSTPLDRLEKAPKPPPGRTGGGFHGYHVAIDPLDAQSVWVWGGQSLDYSDVELFHSADGGATFSPVSLAQASGKPADVSDVLVTHVPGSPARIVVATDEEGTAPTNRQLFESRDGGKSWEPFVGPDWDAGTLIPGAPRLAPGSKAGRVFATNTREAFRLEVRSKTWVPVDPEHVLPQEAINDFGFSANGGTAAYAFANTLGTIYVYGGKV